MKEPHWAQSSPKYCGRSFAQKRAQDDNPQYVLLHPITRSPSGPNLPIAKQKPPKSGGFVFDLQIAYFGLEVPVPVVLEPLSVVVVLFLWCL